MKAVIIICLLFGFSIYTFAGDIKGKITAKGTKNSANAIVYIENIPGKKFSTPKENARIDQKNLVFIPHVLPIVVGTTVEFMNSDDVLHNVFSPDNCAEKFNLGTWPKGEIRTYTFKNPGCFSVMLCNVHPEMEAFIVVLETPYFSVSDKDGSYVIKNVPAGKYSLKIWHEKLKGGSVEITVTEEGTVTHDFVIKR